MPCSVACFANTVQFQNFHNKQSLKHHYVVIDKDRERHPEEDDLEYPEYAYNPQPRKQGNPCPCLSGGEA